MIDSGDYGYCDSCEVSIGIKRLEALPTASQCIHINTIDEIREKQLSEHCDFVSGQQKKQPRSTIAEKPLERTIQRDSILLG